MERDSFIFYRSFYEAVKDLPKDIRLEVYTAIMEYALYGRLPEDLKPFAKGIFTLIKPNIDVNTVRFENGKKGGRKKKDVHAESDYALSYEQEVEQMRNDEKFRQAICEDFNITADDYDKRLSRFLDRCNEEKTRRGKEQHDSLADCHDHLRYWMTKAYHRQQVNPKSKPEDSSMPFPEVGDDFGSMDYDEQ